MDRNSEPLTYIESKDWGIIDPEGIRRLYWEEELSTPIIAERFEMTDVGIRYIMRCNNIPRRSNSEAGVLIWAKRLAGRDKTRKVCPRCQELKSVNEFWKNVRSTNGLATYCKKCMQEYSLRTAGGHYRGLHKRPYPTDGRCEICNIELYKSCYHHWDDNNPSLGIWGCQSCDYFVEGIDEIGRNPWKVDIYKRLKKEVKETELSFKYLGPFLPPNNIRRLYSPNGDLTHKWCSHCGRMLPVNEFGKHMRQLDGLKYRCKECNQVSSIYCQDRQFTGLHKRSKTINCELCGGSKTKLDYHHWDDGNMSEGIWVCLINKCHNLVEAVDKLDIGSSLPNKYIELKQGIILEGARGILSEVIN